MLAERLFAYLAAWQKARAAAPGFPARRPSRMTHSRKSKEELVIEECCAELPEGVQLHRERPANYMGVQTKYPGHHQGRFPNKANIDATVLVPGSDQNEVGKAYWGVQRCCM